MNRAWAETRCFEDWWKRSEEIKKNIKIILTCLVVVSTNLSHWCLHLVARQGILVPTQLGWKKCIVYLRLCHSVSISLQCGLSFCFRWVFAFTILLGVKLLTLLVSKRVLRISWHKTDPPWLSRRGWTSVHLYECYYHHWSNTKYFDQPPKRSPPKLPISIFPPPRVQNLQLTPLAMPLPPHLFHPQGNPTPDRPSIRNSGE